MIHCRHITRRFGAFTALNDVTFDVEAGHICALLGHNGAGKSTLLKILSGLLRPTAGEASVAGHDVTGDSLDLKRSLGVVPETLALFDDLTSGRLFPVGMVQVFALFSAGIAADRVGPWCLAAGFACWAVSVAVYGWVWDRRRDA